MKFSIGQAATETGKPKSTISRAIKTGRISAKKVGNRYEIDPSELFRAFPATVAQPKETNDTQRIKDSTETTLLREMLERERDTVADLRERLTRAELQLTDQRQTTIRRKWFWQK
jgi:excisionase family DNA binding protein